MRLLLYNLRYCAGTGRRFHLPLPWSGYLKRSEENLDQIVAFIRSLRPDIVGLVEVDAGSFRSGRRNQAEVIADALGHYHIYECKYDELSLARMIPVMNKQVNAFLTRDTIVNERFHYFDRGLKRLTIELELDNLVVFLVHLSIGFRVRHRQLSDLFDLVRSVRKPLIVAGDFNLLTGERELRLFQAATGLRNAAVSPYLSYPSRLPRRCLDFILHSREIQVLGFDVPRVLHSDHLPLVCDFRAAGAGV
ncbi:MAG: endonuclease [Lentisphaerae bacterium]|nr:endonuclease [Lentisphaerota bacterium]